MGKRKLTEEQINKLIPFYKSKDVKMDKLCELFGVSDDTIVRLMKKRGVPLRVTVGYCASQNSNWKGGYSLKYAKNLAMRHFKIKKCIACDYDVSVDVHHWDHNGRNNEVENFALKHPTVY